jgi:hypothetical protein
VQAAISPGFFWDDNADIGHSVALVEDSCVRTS